MNILIYARVSSDSQDVELSIGAQLRAVRDYAQKHGHQVVREFVDLAKSARTTNRAGFQEIIELARDLTPLTLYFSGSSIGSLETGWTR